MLNAVYMIMKHEVLRIAGICRAAFENQICMEHLMKRRTGCKVQSTVHVYRYGLGAIGQVAEKNNI